MYRGTATNNNPRATTTTQAKKAKMTEAARYRARDTHVAFFLPQETQQKKSKRPKHRAKPKGLATSTLTNKQRAAWARAHYEQHHDKKPTAPQTPTTPTPTTAPSKTENGQQLQPYPLMPSHPLRQNHFHQHRHPTYTSQHPPKPTLSQNQCTNLNLWM